MDLYTISPQAPKSKVHDLILRFIDESKLEVIDENFDKPWGGYFVINETNLDHFIYLFFRDHRQLLSQKHGKLSPKILVVEPHKRLSFQYHLRRAEMWYVVQGPIGVVQSSSDEQKPVQMKETGSIIHHNEEVRHRLVGLDTWGVVAEIWHHIDADHPSDEDDIVRLEDDFGR